MSQTMPLSPALLPPSAASNHAATAAAEAPAGDAAPSGFAAALSTAALRHAAAKVAAEADAGTGAPASATDPAAALPPAAWLVPWIAPVAAAGAAPLIRGAHGAGAAAGLPAGGIDASRPAAGSATGLQDLAATAAAGAAPASVAGDGVEALGSPPAASAAATDPALPGPALRNAVASTAADATGTPVRGPAVESNAAVATPGSTPSGVVTSSAAPASAPIGGARPDPAGPAADPGAPGRARAEGPGAQSAAPPVAAPKTGPLEAVAARDSVARPADGAPAASALPGTLGTVAPREVQAPTFAVGTPVAGPGWHDDVAKGLAHIVSLRLTEAEIRLNPAHLGPIGIEITYSDNQASVLVTAAQPATRDALEQALPQLKELLAQQGIALGESAVRGEAQPRSEPGTAPAAKSSGPEREVARVEPEAARRALPAGRIDTFA